MCSQPGLVRALRALKSSRLRTEDDSLGDGGRPSEVQERSKLLERCDIHGKVGRLYIQELPATKRGRALSYSEYKFLDGVDP